MFELQFGKLLEIARGRIIEDGRFQLVDAGAFAEALKCTAQQSQVRNDFCNYVDTRAEDSAEKDDVEPIIFRAALDEVPQRQALQDQTPRIEEMTERSQAQPLCSSFACN